MAKLDDLNLDPNQHTDDRWTLTKLRAAGYDEEWARPCRTCGDLIVAYKRVGKPQLLILDEGSLAVHSCRTGSGGL